MSRLACWPALLLLGAACLGAPDEPAANPSAAVAQAVFSNTNAPAAPRLVTPRGSAACALMPDGRLLITGAGQAEIYDPALGISRSVPGGNLAPMTVLKDGRVLTTSGNRQTGFFDPVTETYSMGPQLTLARSSGALVPLSTGGAMYIGGTVANPVVELFDVDGGSWAPGPPLGVARTNFGFTHLGAPNVDTFIITGGIVSDGGQTANVEAYDSFFGWSDAGALAFRVYAPFTGPTPGGGGVSLGGYNNEGFPNSTDTSLNLSNNTLVTSPLLPGGGTGNRVGFFFQTGGIVPNGRLIISGGQELTNQSGYISAFSFAYSLVWTGNTGWDDVPAQMVLPSRSGSCVAVMPNGRLLWAGGNQNNSSSSDTFELYDEFAPSLSALTTLPAPRAHHTATLLRDGDLLLAGGVTGGQPSNTTAVVARDGGSSVGPVLSVARWAHTATLLRDGRVLVVGGENDGGVLASAEVVDAVTGATPAQPMVAARARHTATLLADGTVLVVGGADSAGDALGTSERFDPSTGQWSAGPSLSLARHGHVATLLPGGSLMVAAGASGAGPAGAAPSIEVLAPGASAFAAPLPSMDLRRSDLAVGLMPGGLVVLAGGVSPATGQPSAAVLAWNLRDGGFGLMTSLPVPLAAPSMALLPNGRYLVTGGRNDGGSNNALFTYDPELKTWSTHSPAPLTYREAATATLSLDNRVRLAGGVDGTALVGAVSEYDEGRGAVSAWVPRITSVALAVQGQGAVLRGSVLMGGQWALQGSSSTSPAPVPVVTVDRLDGTMRVPAPARNWTPTQLTFQVPDVASGWYAVRVTVNGTTSAGFPFFIGTPPVIDAGVDAGTVDAGNMGGGAAGGGAAGGGAAGGGAAGGGAAGGGVAGGGVAGGGAAAGGSAAGGSAAGGSAAGGSAAGGSAAGGSAAGGSAAGGSAAGGSAAGGSAAGGSAAGGSAAGGSAAGGSAAGGSAAGGSAAGGSAGGAAGGNVDAGSSMDAGAGDGGVSSKPDLMSCGCSGSPSTGVFSVFALGVLLALRRSRRSSVLAAVLLVPAFASAADRPSVAVLGLRPLNGVKADLASVVTSQLASGVASRGFRVITPAEIEVLLGADRQRQLAGCTENACSAELAGALGSDFIVNGSLANVGTSALVELTLINTKTNAVEQRFASRVKNSTEEAFLDVLPGALEVLFPPAPDATPPDVGRRFGIDLRGQLALQGLGTNWHGNFGPLVTYRVVPWLELGVGALISRTPGGFVRGAVVLGNSWPVQPLLAVEVPVLAAGAPAVGVTGSAGVEWRPVPVLALRAEIPVTYFFTPEAATNFFLLGSLSAGARF